MGYTAGEFWEMTPREFWNAFSAYNQQRDESFRESWNQARMIGFWSMVLHSKKIKKPSDIMKFHWDEKPFGLVSDEEKERIIKEANKALGKKK